MNKLVYLNLSILELSKIVMFWYDCVKPKYGGRAKLYCMDTDSFIVYMKTEGIYADILTDLETRLVHELIPFFGSPRGQNIIWIFSRFLVMGCLNQ